MSSPRVVPHLLAQWHAQPGRRPCGHDAAAPADLLAILLLDPRRHVQTPRCEQWLVGHDGHRKYTGRLLGCKQASCIVRGAQSKLQGRLRALWRTVWHKKRAGNVPAVDGAAAEDVEQVALRHAVDADEKRDTRSDAKDAGADALADAKDGRGRILLVACNSKRRDASGWRSLGQRAGWCSPVCTHPTTCPAPPARRRRAPRDARCSWRLRGAPPRQAQKQRRSRRGGRARRASP